MAENTVWLTIVSVLAVLDLRKAKDAQGNEIDIPGKFTNTFFWYENSVVLACKDIKSPDFSHPEPYQSSITPRDSQARELILAAVELEDF
jgi:hypothetical protein